jgi:hypothetical protein
MPVVGLEPRSRTRQVRVRSKGKSRTRRPEVRHASGSLQDAPAFELLFQQPLLADPNVHEQLATADFSLCRARWN